MTIQSHLDKLREDTPGCRISAFGDLSSKLVLRSSAQDATTREVLDSICDSAVTCFSITDDGASALAGDSHYGQSAIMFTPAQSLVFARPDPKSDDVTLAVVESAQDVEAALQAVQNTMDQIAKEST